MWTIACFLKKKDKIENRVMQSRKVHRPRSDRLEETVTRASLSVAKAENQFHFQRKLKKRVKNKKIVTC